MSEKLLNEALNSAEFLERSKIIGEIEAARRRLLKDQSPLVDGSFDAPGMHDGDQSIADAAKVSISPASATFLYAAVSAFKPRVVLELGTNIGVSAAYLAAGLGPDATLMTLEASRYRLKVAQNLHRELGLTNVAYTAGSFSDSLPGVLSRLPPIEMAFIDGHHQYEPTLQYFSKIWEHSVDGCVFIFDDIRWSDGMKNAWSDLCGDPRNQAHFDLDRMGVTIGSRPT